MTMVATTHAAATATSPQTSPEELFRRSHDGDQAALHEPPSGDDGASARLRIELTESRRFLRFRCRSMRRKEERDSTRTGQRCIGPE